MGWTLASSHDNPSLAARYFDGKSAKAQEVELALADGKLLIRAISADHAGVDLAVSVREVTWPERSRHGKRTAHLPSGAVIECADASAWDAWRAQGGHQDSLVVRAQQNWPWVAASLAALVVALYAMLQWGVPGVARVAVALIPLKVDLQVGERVLDWADKDLLQPSKVDVARQQAIRAAFDNAVKALPPNTVPAYKIVFRSSKIGANALALPGGTMVITDDLVAAFKDDDNLYVGVLAHELGHVVHRHGMRAVVQVTAVGALVSTVVGDASSVMATAAAWLGQASYSREAEREADAESVRVLKAARISPRVMVTAFGLLAEAHGKGGGKDGKAATESTLGIALSSHPADEERRQFFEAAALAR